MTTHEYLSTLRKHWLLILLITVVAGGAAYGAARMLPKQYESTASVLVVPGAVQSAELGQSSSYVQSIVQSYTLLATSPRVLDPVISTLRLEETSVTLAKRVEVESPLNTTVINITTTDPDPEQARRISAAITDSLIDQVKTVSPQVAGKQVIKVETISPAALPTVPASPNTTLYGALGALAGLALSVLYALLRRLFRSRIDTVADAEESASAPILGTVALTPKQARIANTVIKSPNGQVAESLRTVAASLRFMAVDKPRRVILVTSSNAGEGKTSIVLGLALVLAEAGSRVLVVDADLRRPAIAAYTELEGSVGLTNVLVGDLTLDQAVQPWGFANLMVLTSGEQPPNPGQLIVSGRLEAVIAAARDGYDYVLVDSPPVLSVSDPMWLAAITDGTMVVARLGQVTAPELRHTVDTIEGGKHDVLGLVLNGVKAKARNPYYTNAGAPASADLARSK